MPVDRVLENGKEVKLGGVTFIARDAGPPRGCTTWTWKVAEGDKTYDVVVIGSPNVNPGFRLVDNKDYPEIAGRLCPHIPRFLGRCHAASSSGARQLLRDDPKVREVRRRGTAKNPFIDPEGYRAFVDLKEKAFHDTLTAQRARKTSKSWLCRRRSKVQPPRY